MDASGHWRNPSSAMRMIFIGSIHFGLAASERKVHIPYIFKLFSSRRLFQGHFLIIESLSYTKKKPLIHKGFMAES